MAVVPVSPSVVAGGKLYASWGVKVANILNGSVVRFRGLLDVAISQPAGANLPFLSADDPYSGWSAVTYDWTVPAGCGGLYLISAQLRCDAAAAVPLAKIYINGVLTFWGTQGLSAASSSSAVRVTRALAAGDVVACRTHNAYQTNATGGDNFLTVTRMGNS